MSDNLLREIDEEVRRDNLKKIWDRYGVFLIAIAVLVVAGTAGYRGYVAWSANRSASVGDTYLQAVRAANEDRFGDAASLFDEVGSKSVGAYDTLAALREAALHAQEGDTEAAIAGFEAVAADEGVEQTLRDLANLRAAHLMIDTAGYDAIHALAEPHAGIAGPWRHFAREILGLSAFKAGDRAQARIWFETLNADAQAPRNAKGRAELILAVLGDDAQAPSDDDTTTETAE